VGQPVAALRANRRNLPFNEAGPDTPGTRGIVTMLQRRDLNTLTELLRRTARDELLPRFTHVDAARKTDGSVITEADLAMQDRVARELARHWPEFDLLGEEMDAEDQRSLLATPGRGLWCLDPLDGTSNFAAGIPFFGVSLALIQDGEVRVAVVYDPVHDECFSAAQGQGALLNGAPLRIDGGGTRLADAMAMVDLKRLPPGLIAAVATQAPYRSQRSIGSVALDWCWVAAGRCQVYLHGGQKLWDYAAGRLIAHESGAVGGVLADYHGDWLADLTLEPRIAVAATTPALLEAWRAWIRAALDAR
jgi:myo-inositol-1(or 4)-monophosphatase